MNIFFPIGAFYPSQLGGPNNTVYWMTKALVNKGMNVEIVTTHRGVAEDSGIKLNEWVDLGYGKIKYLKVLHRLLPVRLYFNSLMPIIRADIVHLTSLFYSGSLIIAITSLLLRKKIVWSVRGELSPSALKFKSPFKSIILRVIRIISSQIIFHGTSEVEIEYIKSSLGADTKTILLPNYMELPPRVEHQGKRKSFLYLGRVHKIKALDNLVKALASSSIFRNSSHDLIIAGDDDNAYGSKLKELIASLNLNDKIHFEGFVYEDIIKQELLSKAYFLILPSHSENFGNVIIEALAQGTPVIASIGTPWSCLNEKQSGFWTSNKSSQLSKVIDSAINLEEDKYFSMRKNAIRHVMHEFSIEKNIQNWIREYNQVND